MKGNLMKISANHKQPAASGVRNSPAPIETHTRRLATVAPYCPLRKLKKILVPVDFSGPSLKALRYAVPFAEQFGSTITMVYIRRPVTYAPDLPNMPNIPLADMQEDEARKKLFKLGYREIEELIPIDVHVTSGRPADEIVNLAKRLETDLIIMATHGYIGVMHMVMGSTSEEVVRKAPCPVLVVREKEHEFV
jgi:nucleotide-binding universal stress UspA family protein